jgi:uncharacterized protein YcaQ
MITAKLKNPDPVRLSREEARAYFVDHHGLCKIAHRPGRSGVRALLRKLHCIQLDPLDTLGTNADLVALARVDGIQRGDIYKFLYPGHAFEHFAKERCLLPASVFPMYRDHAIETPWWRLSERLQRVPQSLLTDLLDEIKERGPIASEALSDRGRVEPLEWNGWKGTARATSMALEVLWTRCEIVVCGRVRNRKLYDVPSRALPDVASAPSCDFNRWALSSRVQAAGFLSRAGNAVWSMLSDVRTSSLPDEMVAEGLLEEVIIEGSSRPYLAPAGFRKRQPPQYDDRIRILGPLDALLWDRDLVRQIFDFDYVWEVYKPAHRRIWGWYVCPLLHRGQFIGRIDGAIDGDALRVSSIWRERQAPLDENALEETLQRHALACGAVRVTRPRKVLTP